MRYILHIVHWESSGIFGVAKTLKQQGAIKGDQHKIVILRHNKSFVDKVKSYYRIIALVISTLFMFGFTSIDVLEPVESDNIPTNPLVLSIEPDRFEFPELFLLLRILKHLAFLQRQIHQH